MKTLYVSIMAVFIGVTSLHAANMCIQNDASMVVLDPTIGGTANASDATGKTWSTRFSYGIISGIAACYSNVGSTQGVVASDQNMSVYTTGPYCYCKMLRPVQSPWVFSGDNGNATALRLARATVRPTPRRRSHCGAGCSGLWAAIDSSQNAMRMGPTKTPDVFVGNIKIPAV